MYHALTVDVEDYFHVSAFAENISVGQWDKMSCRVERNTQKLIELFAQHEAKCTFFVLGWVAERYPELVRKIHAEGHEVASHGMSHQLIYNQSPEVFREETIRSKKLLEDIIGAEVKGYRAASYSITPRSLWALDILCEAGFSYDSSIFPVHHDRYGMPGAPISLHAAQTASGNEIMEFPLTSAKLGKGRLPVAGGGYFRIYPYFFFRHMYRKAISETGQPAVFYLHPWEVDPDQPRVEGASLLSKFRHYINLSRCYSRLARLVQDFKFTSMDEVISGLKAGSALERFEYK